MDERRFDAWIRALAAPRPRRRALGMLAGGLLAAVGLASEDAALGKRHRKGRGKGRGKRKKKQDNKPNDPQCTSTADCPFCQVCKSGRCIPDLSANGYGCPTCGMCQDGKCVPDAKQDGLPCNDFSCKLCKSGESSVVDHKRCPAGQLCRQGDGMCTPPCLENGRICPTHNFCIDDGIFGRENSCCHVEFDPKKPKTNLPCGENGDGTYKQCCSEKNERCCKADGVCKPKDACCSNETRCGAGCCGPHERCVNGRCDDGCGLTGLC